MMQGGANTIILSALEEAHAGLNGLIGNKSAHEAIAKAAALLTDAARLRKKIYSCGNGGSMCDAMHFAEELTGRFRQNRPAIGALAISDPSHLSCVANDFGYEFVFSRFLEAHANAGDVVLAISTSGASKNIVAAARAAQSLGAKVIALTGKADCELAKYCDVLIATPAGRWADRVQELHIKVIHILIELTELHLA